MNHTWVAHIHFALARWGWPAAVGLLAGLVAPLLVLWGAHPEREAAQALQTQMATQIATQTARAAQHNPTAEVVDPVAVFLGQLPPPQQAIETVKHLHTLAQRHGVQLSTGDYKMATDGQVAWTRYQINLPVSGPYNSVKAWVADAMNKHPTLALDDWQMGRDNVGTTVVQARLRWTLYVGAAR